MRAEISPPIVLPGPPSQADVGMPRFRRLASRFIIPGTNKCDGPRFAFDLEADNLLHNATKLHCNVIVDLDSDKASEYGPKQITAGLKQLARARYLVGHNICNYDLPLLQRLYNWTPSLAASSSTQWSPAG